MIQKHAIPILEFDDNSSGGPYAKSRGARFKVAKEVHLCILEEEIDRHASGSRGGLCW